MAVEADLTDPDIAVHLFDVAERSFGPVDILVNNASGWVADTFKSQESDRFDAPSCRFQPQASIASSVSTREERRCCSRSSLGAISAETRRGDGSLASRPAVPTGSPERCLTELQRLLRRTSRCPPRSNSPIVA